MHSPSVENIVVVDNANSPYPLDDTAAVVAAVHPAVRVLYVPKGLKSLALWTGINALPPHVQYVMHVDDDTKLCADMVFDEQWFLRDESVSEVTYPIFTRRVNLLTETIGFFFKLNSHASVFNNATCGTSLWAAGIIGIARRDVLTSVLKVLNVAQHPAQRLLTIPHNVSLKVAQRPAQHAQRPLNVR